MIVATEHAILNGVWHMLSDGEIYTDLGVDYFSRRNPDREKRNALNRLRALGYDVTLTPGGGGLTQPAFVLSSTAASLGTILQAEMGYALPRDTGLRNLWLNLSIRRLFNGSPPGWGPLEWGSTDGPD